MQFNKHAIYLALSSALVLPSLASASDFRVREDTFACVSEDALSEAVGYAGRQDMNGLRQLLMAGECTVVKAGERVSIASPGVFTATIRYRGRKLYAPAHLFR